MSYVSENVQMEINKLKYEQSTLQINIFLSGFLFLKLVTSLTDPSVP